MKTRVTFFCRLSYSVLTAAALSACSSPRSASLLPQTSGLLFQSADALQKKAAYKMLYLFRGGSTGANPYAGLTRLGSTFYGVTYGDKVASGGFGSVFSITASGKEHTLYDFKGAPDAAEPAGNLLNVNGTLYGTSVNGGKYNSGTIFTISTAGHERVVYSFKNFSGDGANPATGLIELGGKLYGTTINGGNMGAGTVFEASASGSEHPVHQFQGYPKDGEDPRGPLISVGSKLYGTTLEGGANRLGTVFEMDTGGKEGWVYSFAGAPSDGSSPFAGLTVAGKRFYGTTSGGNGAIYAITRSGRETLAYAFKGGPSDGSSPAATLVLVGRELYGTTQSGGAHNMGTIFEAKGSADKVLYSFKGSPKDGDDPYGAMLYDKVSHELYGTTLEGGVTITGGTPYPQAGGVFRFKP